MNEREDWQAVWEAKAAPDVSDFELDRGTSPRGREMERLSDAALIEFIDARPSELVFAAGCSTGGGCPVSKAIGRGRHYKCGSFSRRYYRDPVAGCLG